ncbi:MAG: Gldg family protein [Clostridia bacterium]|nr:Gldg family protein [Clostridia bacterium]
MNSEKKIKKAKASAAGRKALKIGSFSITVTAVVIGIAILLNLFVNELPGTMTKLDTSSLQLFTVGEETEGILSAVDRDVHMYVLAQRGQEDSTIVGLLERYEALNDHVKVSVVDPATNPTFIAKYTEDTLSPNSVIVESDLRHYVLDYREIFTTQYSEEDYYNYMYYGVMPTGTPFFNGELAFTTAVDYVTREDLPVLYALEGHGETALDATYGSYITAENVGMNTLSLLTSDGIPADCSVILINNPTGDINRDELSMLQQYLAEGGNIILVTSYQNYSELGMPNLSVLCAEMGLEPVDGIVFESDRNHYTGYPYSLLPSFGSTGPMALVSENTQYALMHASHGIIANGRATGTVIPMLTTSAGAYVKKVPASGSFTTLDKEDGDIAGQVYTAAAVTGTADGTRAAEYKFVWYASPSISSASDDSYVSGGNSAVFMGSVSWMAENKISLSILAKQLQVEALTLTAAQSSIWSIVVIFVLPLALLAAGFVIWIRRRKR